MGKKVKIKFVPSMNCVGAFKMIQKSKQYLFFGKGWLVFNYLYMKENENLYTINKNCLLFF